MKDAPTIPLYRIAATRPGVVGSSVFATLDDEHAAGELAENLRAAGYLVRMASGSCEDPRAGHAPDRKGGGS